MSREEGLSLRGIEHEKVHFAAYSLRRESGAMLPVIFAITP